MGGSYTVLISVLYLASGIFIFLLGLTILRIGSGSAPTRATALMLFFAGVGPVLSATGLILESNLREGSIVYQNMVENFEYLWEFYFPSLMLFALSFPRENALLRRFPIIGLFVFFPYIVHLAVMMFGDRMLDFAAGLYKVFPADKELSVGSRDVAVGGLDNVIGAFVKILERVHRNLFALVNITYSGIALFLLWRNRRDLLNPRLARQLRTVGIGLAISVTCYTLTKLSTMTKSPLVSHDWSLALINLSLVASGGTIAYAVIRQQFLGIRYVVRRGLLYSGVAVTFAFLYLVVVRPISDFFGQYSAVSKDAFETGFIVLTIIAFQPTLIRTEEVLGRLLLKGRVDAGRKFKKLGDSVASVTTVAELETVLASGFRDTMDTGKTSLVLAPTNPSRTPLMTLLGEIAEPVQRKELDRLRATVEKKGQRGRLRKWLGGGGSKAGHDSSMNETLSAALEGADRELLDDTGASFEVFIPLLRGRECVGYIGLGEKIYGVPYSPEELGHVAVLGTQIGSALQNIQLLKENLDRKLLEEELKIARKIQEQLLPGAPPALHGFDLSAVTVPSRYVGGDYYDFVVVEGKWLVIVVADVSGKGIPASILTASLQATVRSNADAQTDPELMMARLNQLLYRNTSASEFATLFYAVVDLVTGRVRYANAGHDFPFVLRDKRAEQLTQSGIVLGCVEDFEYGTNECEIPLDGSLVIFTDGLTDSESKAGEYFGTTRLKSVLEHHAGQSADEMCNTIIGQVREFGSGENQDDLTLVVLKRSA